MDNYPVGRYQFQSTLALEIGGYHQAISLKNWADEKGSQGSVNSVLSFELCGEFEVDKSGCLLWNTGTARKCSQHNCTVDGFVGDYPD